MFINKALFLFVVKRSSILSLRFKYQAFDVEVAAHIFVDQEEVQEHVCYNPNLKYNGRYVVNQYFIKMHSYVLQYQFCSDLRMFLMKTVV